MNMQKKFKCGVVYILAFVVFFTNIPMSVQAVEHESMEIDVKDNIWEGDVAKKFDSGDGTVSNPYIISNGAELRYFADEITNGENFYNKYIDISDDIYLNDVTNYSEWSKSQSPQNIWEPIGGNFAGTLDGNGHSIVGVYINSNEDKTGFFRELSLNSIPTIKNIQLKNIFVAGESKTGGLVGHATFLDCTNVTVMGKISGKDSVGGFVGDGVGRRITGPINFVNCSNYASVEGKENKVGGIIGNYSNSGSTNDKLLINNCRNSGSVSGNEFVGGLGGCFIAETDSQGIMVSKSINEGTIGGCSKIGGIIGEIDSNMKTFEISQVCNFGNISATEGNAGGIVGVAYVGWRLSKMDNLYNTGKVSGTVAGGLAGYGGTFTYGSLSIQNFYNLGEISGKSKSYEGIAEAEIAGWGTQMITMENAYYEKEKNLNANAIVTKNSVELDSNQFLDTNSFKGFDFDNVWTMSGYGPIFQWQLEEQKCGENAYWSVSGDVDNLTLKISGSGDTFDYDVNEQNPWFYKYKIKNVIIGDDITSIGAYLFAYDSNIKTVKLGKSIDKIKENAFLYCNNLTEICIPSGVKYIGDWSFAQSGLQQIEFKGDAPRLFDCTFYGVKARVKFHSNNNGWEDAQKSSYGGSLTWIDLYGTFNTNYVKYSSDLFDHTLPEIPSKNKGQYAEELYSWAEEYGYEDVLTKEKCKEIVSNNMPSVVAEDDYGTYVTYKDSTASIMRDILMINATKKALIKWEKNEIKNSEVKELATIYKDVNKIVQRYNEYEQDTQRSALSSIFYSIYANELLKNAGGVVLSISGDYFNTDIKEDINNADIKEVCNDLLERKINLSNLGVYCEGISEEVIDKIKEEFPKKFTKKVCKEFVGKVINQNKDVESFTNVYNELSNYVGSFKGDSLIAQFGAQSILPIKLLKLYVDLMKEIDDINQGKYFMLQYSLMRYYPDLYDKIIDEEGNVIDLVDSYLIEIDSAFVREQLDNWYNTGGATIQLSDKQKFTLMNTATLVMQIEDSNPMSMKQKLVQYWYEHEKNDLTFKQSELILNSQSEFCIQDKQGNTVGHYKNNNFVLDDEISQLSLLSNNGTKSVNMDAASQVLYSDDKILVELGATKSYVHIIFTDRAYKCLLEKTDGEIIAIDASENDSKTKTYSELSSNVVVSIDEDGTNVTKDGVKVPDDSHKKTNNVKSDNDSRDFSSASDSSSPSGESDAEVSCGESKNNKLEDPDELNNSTYVISIPSKKLAAGTKVKLSISTKESTLDNTSIIWCSSNKSYATINKKGVVNCKKAGIGKKVTITAKSTDGTEELASITFKIMKNAVTGVKIKKAPKTLKIGESANLKAVVTTNGNSANTTLKWTSSNKKYVTVSKKGKIIAKRAGKGKCVVITVTSTDGSDKKTSIKVKVK